MNILIIEIQDTCLRTVLSSDGVLVYCRSFDFMPLAHPAGTDAGHGKASAIQPATAADNPYLIYQSTEGKNPWNLALRQIIRQIRSDITCTIDSTHFIIPAEEVTVAAHHLPKMSRPDAQKLIGRKIRSSTKEEFPPFSIIPGASDQNSQIWYSLYIPSSTLQNYRKAFSSCRLRLSSITTSVNAMINAFQGVREAIFNTYAVFEIQRSFVNAYYISSDGILHFDRLSYGSSATAEEESNEKSQKNRLFKIINTIFSINSIYQNANPRIPVQMVWICGVENGLEDIAAAIKEAMGIEVAIAPVIHSGLPDESGYVPLAGFASALLSGTATAYSAVDFFRRFPLRKTSGIFIYAVTSVVALLTVGLTEREYRNLRSQVQRTQLTVTPKQGLVRPAVTTRLETLKTLASRQFIFYNLFRELANDLPDGVFLESLEFHLKDDKGVLNITALAHLSDKIGESMLLSKFMKMLDHSPTLKNHHEPSISPVSKDKERYLQISVTSEVSSLDTSK